MPEATIVWPYHCLIQHQPALLRPLVRVGEREDEGAFLNLGVRREVAGLSKVIEEWGWGLNWQLEHSNLCASASCKHENFY